MATKFFNLEAQTLAAAVREARLPDPATRRQIRERANVTLREMAQVMGVAPMTIQRWECGRACPRREDAVRYRDLLDELVESMR